MPAGVILVGGGIAEEDFGFGFRDSPRDSGFGVGERGVLKGCAALVEVAAGGPLVRGLAVAASRREIEVVNVREGIEWRTKDAPLRRQERQIIVVMNWDVVVDRLLGAVLFFVGRPKWHGYAVNIRALRRVHATMIRIWTFCGRSLNLFHTGMG